MVVSKHLIPRLTLVATALFSLIPSQGVAMSIFDAGKVCLFSKISGTITLDGKPAANATVIRTVNLNKNKTDQTTTDENGYFEMPAVFQRTVTKFLPQEFVSTQTITVNFNQKVYRMWHSVKRSPEENTEAKGKPLKVKCDLGAEEKLINVNRAPIFSLCEWDVEPDVIERIF
jgi:hypothetical protein